jgi:hypothetical protein
VVLLLPLQGYALRPHGTRPCARRASAETALPADDAGTSGPSQWDTTQYSPSP